MKTKGAIAWLFLLGATSLYAEAGYTVVERGDSYKVMQKVTIEHGTNRVHKYTVLGNGMNRQDGTGNYVECLPVIQNFQGGILCTGATYQVIFSHNINTYGAIDFEAPDKTRILSNPLGIGFYDPDSGKSVILAHIRDSSAELSSSNQVVYRDAFAGVGIPGIHNVYVRPGPFSSGRYVHRTPRVFPAGFRNGK